MKDTLPNLRNIFSDFGFQRYFKNTTWMFSSRILSMGISFLATIYIARNLGPTNFGQLSYALSFIGLFGFLASLGVDGIVYRDLITSPEKRLTILGTGFVLRFSAGVTTAFLVSLSVFFVGDDDVSKILILILSCTFFVNAFQIIVYDFQSRTESKYTSIISVMVTGILNFLKIIVIITGGGVIYLALVLLLESFLYALLYLYIYHIKTKDKFLLWKFELTYAKQMLKDSFPLIVMSAFATIYARIDQVLIKHIMDSTSVGLYDSAVRLSELWSFIPGIIIAAIYPAIINAKKVSEESYCRRLGYLATFLVSLAILIAIPISLLAKNIMHIIYGPEFLGGVIVLKVYIWASVGTFLGILITQYLVTENMRRVLLFIAFAPMACNVGLNLLWIPTYGIAGAAYATLISYSLAPLCVLLFKEPRKRILSIYKTFF